MTERGDATRARLIEATLNVVREVGYAHASTRAIAQAAGVAEGTIYRHFPDKASLFFATILESNAPIVAWVTAARARGQGTVEANLIDAAVQLAGLRDQIVPLELAIVADPELAAQRRQAIAAAGTRCRLARPRPSPRTWPPSSGWGASARTSTRKRPRASSSGCCSRWAPCRASMTRAPAPCASHPRSGSSCAGSGVPRPAERAGPADQASASFPSRPRPIVPRRRRRR